MKSEKIIEFIRHPEKINNDDLRELHTLVERYPYFQTARILYLKALYLLGGVRFRSELKASTVHLTDHKQFQVPEQSDRFRTLGFRYGNP